MNKIILTAAAAVTISACAIGASTARAWFPSEICAGEHAARLPWSNNYYDPTWGQPIALVVPPTAERQTQWGWGVCGFRTVPIWHQFHRRYPGDFGTSPGAGAVAGPFVATPSWPSDTNQFGVYYVRGPW